MLEQVLYAANAAQKVCCLIRQINRLGVVTLSYLLHHLDILLREQIVGGVGACSYSLCDLANGYGLCFCLAYACLCLTFSPQNLLLLGCLCAVDGRGLFTFRLQDGCLLLTL